MYNYEQLEVDLAELGDLSVNKSIRLQNTLDALREHYVKLCTIAGKLKGRTMLLSSAAGRKDYGYGKEQIEQIFSEYEKVRGYIELLDKTTTLMQSISKHTPEL